MGRDAATLGRSISVAHVSALLILCLLLSACGAPAAAPPPTPEAIADGVRYTIADRRMFLSCTGSGSPTVLLEAGLGADHTAWAAAQPQIAPITRVCSYDRAGTGLSDPADPGRGAAAAAQELAALLNAAGERGPYVVIGHSFGGLIARSFAATLGDDLAGLVLVDSVHEDYWTRAAALLPPPGPADTPRLQAFRELVTTTIYDPARNPEGFAVEQVVADLHAAGDLGDRPLVILVAGQPDFLAPGLPPDVAAAILTLHQDTFPRELATQSNNSAVVVVPDSGHNISAQRPDMIVLAVQAVLAAAPPVQ
jgi:pimeloyl-ACP methyl ester carboxylesterase